MAHAQISLPDPQEHVAQGKAARKAYPRSALANIEFPADRRDPVDILMAQSESRVQELVPIRYGRMSASPFTFYRGAAAIMAADLGVGPNTGLTTQLCGDAHLANFGWEPEVCDGVMAGTTGQSRRIEALKVRVASAPTTTRVYTQAHVQDVGWQPGVFDGQIAGTTGQSKRLEAVKIQLVPGGGFQPSP